MIFLTMAAVFSAILGGFLGLVLWGGGAALGFSLFAGLLCAWAMWMILVLVHYALEVVTAAERSR